MDWHRQDGYQISDDPGRVDRGVVHRYLHDRSYWSTGIPRETFDRALAGSMVFGVYDSDGTVGFARVVTDRATFAWVCDVFVLPEHQGRGLGTWLMQTITEHPELQGLRRWMLGTRDAHAVYERVGFRRFGPRQLDRMMLIARSPEDLYGSS